MVRNKDIKALSNQIVTRFDPEQIILFGSYASGKPGNDSDVDLLVVMRFEGRRFRQSVEILNAIRPKFPVDLIVWRPEEVKRRYRLGDPLIGDALDKGRVIYARSPERVD